MKAELEAEQQREYDPCSRSSSLALLVDLGWLAAAISSVVAIHFFGLAREVAAVVIALLGMVHSLNGFIRHGGARISAPGVFLVAMALFGYFPTIYYHFLSGEHLHDMEVTGLTLLLSSQALMYMVWRRTGDGAESADKTSVCPQSVTMSGLWFGTLLLSGAIAMRGLGLEGLGSLTRAMGFAGTVLIAMSLISSRERVRAWMLFALAGLFVVFFSTMFTEGGRLVLGSMAMSLALAAGTRWRPRYLKVLAVLAIPVGVDVLARMRSVSRSDWASGYYETGFESVVWPQRRFFDVVQSVTHEGLPLGWGETFLNSLVVWVPRELWPNKPVGFGTELTLIYKPHLLQVGHSEAALVHGEFVYNFGVAGILALTLVCAWFVLALDRLLVRAQSFPVATLRQLLARAMLIIAVACLLDFVWVGTFTYAERAGFAVASLFPFYLVAAIVEGRPGGARGQPPGKVG